MKHIPLLALGSGFLLFAACGCGQGDAPSSLDKATGDTAPAPGAGPKAVAGVKGGPAGMGMRGGGAAAGPQAMPPPK